MIPEIRIVNSDIEIRHTQGIDYASVDAEIRMSEPDPTTNVQRVNFYPVVLNSYSEDLGGFREIIRDGSINRALEPDAQLAALRDHNSSMLLGTTKAGTLIVSGNKRGLLFDIDPPDTTYANDAKTLIKRGDLTGASFGFRVLRDNWKKVDGEIIREVLDMIVHEGSIVTFPAYRATSVSMRVIERAKEMIAPSMVVPDLSIFKAKLALTEL